MISFAKLRVIHKTILKHIIKSIEYRNQLVVFRSTFISNNNSRSILETIDKHSNESLEQYLKNERQFTELTTDSFQHLIKDKQTEDRIQSILTEYEYQKYTTLLVPKTLTSDHMRDLLLISTPTQRNNMFRHLLFKEIYKTNEEIERKVKSEKFLAQKNQKYSLMGTQRSGIFDSNGNLMYGLWHNSMTTKFYPKNVKRLYANRLRVSALFGQKILLDLDYDQYMDFIECEKFAKQISHVLGYNKYKREEPFDIQFTNCQMNGQIVKSIEKFVSNCHSPTFMTQLNNKSYLDLYPKENLVYLSPLAEHSFNYNSDDIYIIGGFAKLKHNKQFFRFEVEKRHFLKAKKEGIRVCRLPIDEHIIWRDGNKSLDISIVLSILYELRLSANWSKALKENIPAFNQKNAEDIAFEDSIRKFNIKYFDINTND